MNEPNPIERAMLAIFFGIPIIPIMLFFPYIFVKAIIEGSFKINLGTILAILCAGLFEMCLSTFYFALVFPEKRIGGKYWH